MDTAQISASQVSFYAVYTLNGKYVVLQSVEAQVSVVHSFFLPIIQHILSAMIFFWTAAANFICIKD